MAELLTGLILLGGLLIAASMVHAGRKLKAYLRLRRMRKLQQFRQDWNPTPTAMRQFSQARVVRHPGSAHRATASERSVTRGPSPPICGVFSSGRDSEFGG